MRFIDFKSAVTWVNQICVENNPMRLTFYREMIVRLEVMASVMGRFR